MSAVHASRASRTAWWRRWAGLPAVLALFFATSVIAGTPQTAPASKQVPAPAVLQVLVVSAPQITGQRPDLPVIDHSGPDRTAPHPMGLAWLPERAATTTITWWHPRHDSTAHRARTSREAHRVRGPPGRLATAALS